MQKLQRNFKLKRISPKTCSAHSTFFDNAITAERRYDSRYLAPGCRLSMYETRLQTLLILSVGLAALGLVLFFLPGYLATPEVLGSVIIAQIILASVCKYKKTFFLVLMLAFLWAGVRLPMDVAWLKGRWIVLAIGALVGAAIYMRERDHRFGVIHLFALFCVLSSLVSSSASAYPQEALLKSLSLFLLFLYGAMGARLAVPAFEPQKFFHKLLLGCEITTYITCFTYFALRFPLFGNPNSLGAVMGVVVVPVIFWGFLCADAVVTRRRLGVELCIASMLLMSSFSRAGIAAAAISCLLILIALRQYRVIVTGTAAALIIAVLTVAFAPRPPEIEEEAQSETLTSLFLYKGKPNQGLLGSRKGTWDRTIAVIKAHPWFGSGFGTSVTDRSAMYFELTRSRFIDSRMVREHGNSYLAILEWSGLFGVFPFYFLVGIAATHARKALVNLGHTRNIWAPAVPAAAIIIAGLVGAAFEDWLFASGYYVSVFFWAMAFILADLVQPMRASHAIESTVSFRDPQPSISPGLMVPSVPVQ